MRTNTETVMRLCKYRIIGIFKVPFLIAAFLSACSCTADREGPASGDRRTGEVRIGAYIDEIAGTRAQGFEYIDSGTYWMTYPNYDNNTTHSVCKVNFFGGFGVTTTWANKELKWENVGSLTYDDALTNFFLDNVAPPEGIDPNTTEIVFTDDWHPFDAAVYAGDGGYNDLLWGYTFAKLNNTTEDINIGIHHYLSRVSVIVTVDNTLEHAQEINFGKGSVRITNVVKKGLSYDRTNGSIALGPDYEDLDLAVEGDWESVDPDETDPRITYFQTKNFVLPPQPLRTDEMRPRLVLDVPQPDGTIRTYSGVIPRVMIVDGSPATMAFDPEKNLTLKVKISQDQLRIESIVAYVQDWVDKGSFRVSADRAGIFSTADLTDLIDIYKKQDYDELTRYGYRHVSADGTVTWSFNIFTQPRVPESAAGKMGKDDDGNGLPDFSLDMTPHYFYLEYADGTERMFGSYDPKDLEASRNAARLLHDLLRDGTVPKPEDGLDPNASGGGEADGEVEVD